MDIDGEGGSSEECLKWGGGGSLRDLSKNILKQGVGKGKSCSEGGGGLKVSQPLPPPKNFNHTHGAIFLTDSFVFMPGDYVKFLAMSEQA